MMVQSENVNRRCCLLSLSSKESMVINSDGLDLQRVRSGTTIGMIASKFSSIRFAKLDWRRKTCASDATICSAFIYMPFITGRNSSFAVQVTNLINNDAETTA